MVNVYMMTLVLKSLHNAYAAWSISQFASAVVKCMLLSPHVLAASYFLRLSKKVFYMNCHEIFK